MDPQENSPARASERSIRLAEDEARAVLCVRAVEEVDHAGEWLDLDARERATEANRDERSPRRALVGRALELVPRVDQAKPQLARVRAAAALRVPAPWLVLLALVAGAASNLLGPEKRINVVANPIAALVAWNVLVYLLLLVGLSWGGRGRGAPFIERVAVRLSTWRARVAAAGAGSAESGGAGRAAAAFVEHWARIARPLLGARIRAALHLAAAAMVIGALAGMYARGLLFEYRATWESTFLDADAVQGWLGFMLAPGALLSAITLPEVASIETPAHGDAADWIHLYALTTVAVVVVPRLVLAGFARARARRLGESLELAADDPYVARILRGVRGGGVAGDVVPYSYTLPPQRADRLKALLHDVFGARADLRLHDSIPYGAEGPWEPSADGAGPEGPPGVGADVGDGASRVVLFSLSQTPESEVHGRFVQRATRGLTAGGACLVLVDEAAWRERADAATLERRLGERRRTWTRVLREAGLDGVFVDLDRAPDDALVARVDEAVWTRYPQTRG